VGSSALEANTTGFKNVALGKDAGFSTTTGDYNTFIGMTARGQSATSNSEIVMGYNIEGVGANYMTVGWGTTKSYLSYGATSWSGTSDSRLKDNITSSTAGLSFINDLRPVTFDWKTIGNLPETFDAYEKDSTERYNNTDKVQHGFIAQEVKAAIDAHPEIASGHGMWQELSDGTQGIAQGQLVPMLTKAIQELSTQLDAALARITTLEG
jgi:hypothetical protein